MRRAKLLCVLALSLAAACSFAAQPFACARALYPADLESVIGTANASIDGFHDAVSSMSIDKSSATAGSVGAAMMAGAVAQEVAATAEGLRQLTLLRNQLSASGREVALQHLDMAMKDASARLVRVSETYGKVAAMSADPQIKSLAEAARVSAKETARLWSCE
ncbi:hypothetical protein [Paucibacter soli]|uniref:hypothetical protein n=1 Tax=Paucibacter soli TaxID=3133433 RepID=UPI0030B30A16